MSPLTETHHIYIIGTRRCTPYTFPQLCQSLPCRETRQVAYFLFSWPRVTYASRFQRELQTTETVQKQANSNTFVFHLQEIQQRTYFSPACAAEKTEAGRAASARWAPANTPVAFAARATACKSKHQTAEENTPSVLCNLITPSPSVG